MHHGSSFVGLIEKNTIRFEIELNMRKLSYFFSSNNVKVDGPGQSNFLQRGAAQGLRVLFESAKLSDTFFRLDMIYLCITKDIYLEKSKRQII